MKTSDDNAMVSSTESDNNCPVIQEREYRKKRIVVIALPVLITLGVISGIYLIDYRPGTELKLDMEDLDTSGKPIKGAIQ